MRIVFHAMLALSVAIALTGMALGAQGRLAGAQAPAGSSHTAALHRAPRDHVPFEATIAPPVPESPRFAAEVAGAPKLAWHLEDGTDGARLELCPTSDFDEAKTVRMDVRGDKVQLPSPWPPGVWYWRLRGRSRGSIGDRATPTWMLYVTSPQSTAVVGEDGELGFAAPAPPVKADDDWYARVAALIDEVRAPGHGEVHAQAAE